MNSSFLFYGQMILASLALLQLALFIFQFGAPRDTVRSLAFLFHLALSLMLITDLANYFGLSVVIKYPSVYGVYLGIMGLSWPAFIWLGVVDFPSQLQRKIMWRLPLIGGLLGHALPVDWVMNLFIIGWLAGFAIIAKEYQKQRFILRILVGMLFLSLVYNFCIRNSYFWAAQISFAVWILATDKVFNAFLVKNRIREFSAIVQPEKVS